jgi:hypothetical protein
MVDLQPIFMEIIGGPNNSIALRLHRFYPLLCLLANCRTLPFMSIDNSTVKLY